MEITGGCLCRAVRWACINQALPRIAARPPPIA